MNDSQYNPVNDQRFHGLLAWLAQLNINYQQVSIASADAGTRRYFRLHNKDNSVLAVDADPKYEDTGAFIDIAARIAATSVRVPDIYHYNLEKGYLLIEDLGDTHVQRRIAESSSTLPALYRSALTDLITLQRKAQTIGLPDFDREFIRFELAIFEDWYLQKHLGLQITPTYRDLLDQLYDVITGHCEAQPQVFMHRDYHSRNLMVSGAADLTVIDFQGAMLGPVTYDIGSLLRDAYLSVPSATERDLCELHRASLKDDVSPQDYQHWYTLTALQRHLKVLGIFCRLNYRDHKANYMKHLNTVSEHVMRTTATHAELSDFHRFFTAIVQSEQQ